MERLAGVQKAEVSFKAAQAVVQYDPGRVTIEEMVQAVKNAGFGCTPVP